MDIKNMSNEEILEKCIKKAIDNNFLNLKGKRKVEINVFLDDEDAPDEKEICIIHDWETFVENGEEIDCKPWCCGKKIWFSVNDLIFNKEFAKCFWGYELIKKTPLYFLCECPDWKNAEYREYYETQDENWQYHLKVMVLEKEPLKYLEKFLL